MSKEEYRRFLDNDEWLAELYGKNVQLFRKNKVPVDFKKVNYDFVKLHETTKYSDFGERLVIEVKNPYQLKIRPEKQIAEILGISGNQVKSLLEKGEMEFETRQSQFISVSMGACQFPMDK